MKFAITILMTATILLASTLAGAKAYAKELCFTKEFDAGTSIKVTYLGKGTAFQPDRKEAFYYKPAAAVFVKDLQPIFEQLEPIWQTPASSWAIESVLIEFKERYTTTCKVVYSKSRIFAQYDDLNGFVTQGISPRFFEALNDIVMEDVSLTTIDPENQ